MSQNPGTGLAPIEPTTMGELEHFAAQANQSGFFGVKNKEQALILAMTGRDLGLSYTQALRAFHVINGRPAMSADGMVAIALGHSDVCEYFTTIETTSERCTVETKRRGSPAAQRLTFTMADAKAAGLSSPNWTKFPAAMLRARAKSSLARDVYPDLLMGLYDPDEIEAPAAAPAATVIAAPALVVAPVPAPAPSGPNESWPAAEAAFLIELDTRAISLVELDAYLATKGSKPASGLSDLGRAKLIEKMEPGTETRAAYDAWVATQRAVEGEYSEGAAK
jgi:hypothetical protein